MASDFDDATRWGASAEAWRRGLASIGALIAAALLIVLVVLVQVSNHERDAALQRERHSYDVLVIARGLDATMAKAEAALGRFVISGDRATGALYYDEWLQAGQTLKRLHQVTEGDAAQAPLIAELEALYRTRGDELAATALRTTYRQGWTSLSLFYQAGEKPSVRLIARVLDRISDNERARLRGLSDVAEASVGRSNRLATALSGLGVLLVLGAIVLGWLAVLAIARRNAARASAAAEAERAVTLEQAVAARTHELSEANAALREEAATRAAAEAKLAQVQKMEAVGQLTGGIAHDFNNMLAVVVGGLDLARRRLDGDRDDDARRHLDSALEGADRAAALTRRLLAFARAEPLLPEAVDPARLIAGMSDLIDRTIGERFEVESRLDTRGWLVWCDPSRLENAILNLAVNARDAMGDGGRMTIAAAPATLAAGEVGVLAAGDHLRIDVIDRGCGMSPEVVDRVFEPFFTTKPVGRGTGLGLSQIFGFARQSGGDVVIDSVPGRGTTVSLYLPRHRAVGLAAVPPVQRPAEEIVAMRGARILLVEDDPRVRAATVDALEELGHAVSAHGSGEEALHALDGGRAVDLVITDVVMPGMTGPELVDRIARAHPGLGVLFVTGYVGEAGDAESFRGFEVLRKPFTVAGLANAVAAALERSRPIEQAA